MRTRFCRNDLPALFAIKRVFEHQRRDADFFWLELVKDFLRVVRAIVIADAGVIAPDDDVRASVILAADRVKDRFARTRIAHRRGEYAEHHAVGRIVIAQEFLVRLHSHIRRNVVGFRFADEWMQE